MRYISSLFFALVVLLGGPVAYANHVYGADFFYEHVRGDSFKVSLVIYGDCHSLPVFTTLDGATPQVLVLQNGVQKAALTLIQSGPGVEVTPVCPALLNSTVCTDPSSTLPGVKRYTYTAIYKVPYHSRTWIFRFAGNMGGAGMAGRSNQITNIVNPGSSVVTMEALLNDSVSNNSSPKFTTIPTPFFCINVPQQYNQGAVDIDNDSLVYALVAGLQGLGTVSYAAPYSATAPLQTASGTFSFSSVTGQMNFTPDAVQKSLVVNEVYEYKNGVLVGTSSREMTFVVLNNCNFKPASNMLDTNKSANSGGVSPSKTLFNVCQGTDSIHFGIIAVNPGGDTLQASVTGLPAGAKATIVQDSTPSPLITVDWPTSFVTVGTYNFFVTYKDNGCPLTSTQTVAYTIQVVRPNTVHASIAAATHCIHKAYIKYDMAYGLQPRFVTIKQSGNLIDSFVDNTGTGYDSLAVGAYDVTVSSSSLLCTTTYKLNVVDSGLYPFRPKVVSPVYYCKGDLSMQLLATPDTGAALHWWDYKGITLAISPNPPTDVPGIYVYTLSQQYKVCESLKDSIQVYVTNRPTASFTGPDAICVGDTASFTFNGTVGVGPILDYIWDWDKAGYTNGAAGGPWQVRWYGAGTKTVSLRVEENKCASYAFTKDIDVKAVPFAGFNVPSTVCQYDSVEVVYNTKPKKGQQYTWDFAGADQPAGNSEGPYTLRYNTPGEKHISLFINLDGCTDRRDTVITVNPAPVARITNVPAPVCVGDKVYLEATGGSSYVWTPGDHIFYDQQGKLYALVLEPTNFEVMVKTDQGCVDSAFANYKTVEPCCKFSYPNAFTPNNDGHNDQFRIVTYGNQVEFELSIYNKWGQRVFHGHDAMEGWDGSFNGKPCDAGTYFYYLNATCYTGHQEIQKGDLILVR